MASRSDIKRWRQARTSSDSVKRQHQNKWGIKRRLFAPYPSPGSPIEAWITGMPISIANSAADWITLEAFDRYPNLKMALSEGGIGWVPYLLERADFTNRHHSAWTRKSYGNRTPSELFRDHIITCFIEDDFGLANRHYIGVDNICVEVDYPHSDCTWPNMPEGLWRSLESVPGGIPDDEIQQMTWQNAAELFRLDVPASVIADPNSPWPSER